MTTLTRETGETRVTITLASEAGPADGMIQVEDAFLAHMVRTFGRYSGLHLAIEAAGDLRHHLVEDVAITLGLALRDVIPERCARYGSAVVPMDEALVQAAVDAGGRFYYHGRLPSVLYQHFFRSLAENAAMTLHLLVLRGRDRHHVVEASFKAFGLALRQALVPGGAVFSTKGAVRVSREEQ